jgi:succinate-acetate transporter protein
VAHPDATASNGSLAPYTRITLRPIGSPLPLGLLALACAALLFSLQQLGAFAPTEGRTIALIVIGFVVPLLAVTAVLSFLARDTVAGTALGLFTGAWLASALVTLTSPPGQLSHAFGAFLCMMAACLAVLIVGASFGKAGLVVVIVCGSARFLLTGLYELTGDVGVEHAAGVVGLALCAAAVYAALATEIEDVKGEVKLPLGRRAKAREALEAPFDNQLERLEHEAGVRQQL